MLMNNVRTSYHAIAAANASIIVHFDKAIRPVIGRLHRAYVHAWCVLTVHAWAWDVNLMRGERVIIM